jgi:DNA repair protein RadC
MSQRIQDMPHDDRPRERLLRLGPESLSDGELIGLFIHTGVKGENAVQIAQRVLREAGGLVSLSRLAPMEISGHHGIGPAKAALITAAMELGKRAARAVQKIVPLGNPRCIYDYLGLEMQALHQEELHVLSLNSRMQLVHHDRVYRGTLTETSAHPRDVLRFAIMRNAHSFALVHNHPSGDPSPSDADWRFTRRIREASKLMQIEMTDHVIIGQQSPERTVPWFSFRESGGV